MVEVGIDSLPAPKARLALLRSEMRHATSKDEWMLLLDFATATAKDGLKGYDESAAWPVVIDTFVEHLTPNKLASFFERATRAPPAPPAGAPCLLTCLSLARPKPAHDPENHPSSAPTPSPIMQLIRTPATQAPQPVPPARATAMIPHTCTLKRTRPMSMLLAA